MLTHPPYCIICPCRTFQHLSGLFHCICVPKPGLVAAQLLCMLWLHFSMLCMACCMLPPMKLARSLGLDWNPF
jgi:hypothetical protein